jgi:hypothetical protein
MRAHKSSSDLTSSPGYLPIEIGCALIARRLLLLIPALAAPFLTPSQFIAVTLVSLMYLPILRAIHRDPPVSNFYPIR